MQLIADFDYNTLFWIHNNMVSPYTTKFMSFMTSLGNAGFIWIAIAIILISIKKYRKVGVILTIALILCVIIGNGILKNWIGRIRPFDSYNFGSLLIKKPGGFSFPSGHTASSFASAFVLLKANKKWGIIGYIIAILIAFSRLYFCVHYPTDILGGVVFGTLVGILAFYIYKYVANSKGIHEYI